MCSGGYCSRVCVSLTKSHLTSRMSNCAINERIYSVAYECQKDFSEMTVFKSYGMILAYRLCSTHNAAPEVTQRLSTT